jgi:hypothetical protein
LERVASSTAVAMKYSSHDGRCGKLLAASAIKSTGRTGTGGTEGVSGAGIAGELMECGGFRQLPKGGQSWFRVSCFAFSGFESNLFEPKDEPTNPESRPDRCAGP